MKQLHGIIFLRHEPEQFKANKGVILIDSVLCVVMCSFHDSDMMSI